MRRIELSDIEIGWPVVAVEVPYDVFLGQFGARHSDHPADWDAPGPVELWFFELPWGHRIILEYHLLISQVQIHVDSLEIDAVLEFLGLGGYPRYLDAYEIGLMKNEHSSRRRAQVPCSLYRQDDNGNQFLVQSYESERVASYYQQVYEARGHKQSYWVEASSA